MRHALIAKAKLMALVLIAVGVIFSAGCQNRAAQGDDELTSSSATDQYNSGQYQPLSAGAVIRPVQFSMKIYSGSSGALLPENLHTQIAPLLERFDRWDQVTQVTITGHTDAEGSDISNMRLSLRRAQALADQLIEAGVPAAVLQVKGRGEQSPIASNTSITGKQLNRRVDVIAYGLVEEAILRQTAKP